MDGLQASAHLREWRTHPRATRTCWNVGSERPSPRVRVCVSNSKKDLRACKLHQRSGYVWQDSDDGLSANGPCAATYARRGPSAGASRTFYTLFMFQPRAAPYHTAKRTRLVNESFTSLVRFAVHLPIPSRPLHVPSWTHAALRLSWSFISPVICDVLCTDMRLNFVRIITSTSTVHNL